MCTPYIIVKLKSLTFAETARRLSIIFIPINGVNQDQLTHPVSELTSVHIHTLSKPGTVSTPCDVISLPSV